MNIVQGVVPVLSTPLHSNGEIDKESLVRLCKYLISFPIGGLWVLGTGSEDMNLSFNKRVQVALLVSETVNETVPVMIGASFFCMEDSLSFIQTIKPFNFSSYHIMPYHPLLSPRRLEWYYNVLADACPKPLWVYTSGNWSQQLSFESINRLKKHPNICGIKYSTSNAVNVLKMARLADDNFQLITAIASQMHSCLCDGSKAHTSSLASALPEPMLRIWELFQDGRIQESLTEQYKLQQFLEEFSKAKKDNFLWAAEEKYLLSLKGICKEYITSYYRNLSNEEKNEIVKTLQKYGYFVKGD